MRVKMQRSNPFIYLEDEGISSFENPVKKGYEFEGWYLNKEFTGGAIAKIAADCKEEISL